jgi:hypothetical protein
VQGDHVVGCQISLLPRKVIFVRSKGEDDAVVRLSSLPLCAELRRRGIESFTLHPKDTMPPLDASDCVVFHYNDIEAVVALRDVGTAKPTVICLGSDIYSFSKYLDLQDLVSYYLVPTDMHRLVLSGMVYRPVYTLPETIDRPAAGHRGYKASLTSFPEKKLRRVCWFGYSESFEKGMASLVPVIKNAIAAGQISSFTLILDTKKFYNRWGLETVEFDLTTFADIARNFDYVILSHLPLDLQVNSMIKSSNKAVTSLFSGLIPLASNTPSYHSLLGSLGLDRFLFTSPRELGNLLTRLDPLSDSLLVRKLRVLETLNEGLGESVITQQFLDHHQRFLLDDNEHRTLDIPRGIVLTQAERLYFSDLVRALGPAALLALRNRFERLMSRGRKKRELPAQ